MTFRLQALIISKSKVRGGGSVPSACLISQMAVIDLVGTSDREFGERPAEDDTIAVAAAPVNGARRRHGGSA